MPRLQLRLPKFRRDKSGCVILNCTPKAPPARKKREQRSNISLPPEEVRKQAIEAVKKRSGDVNNEQDVQGEYLLQFTQYQGKSFRWVVENDLGFVAYMAYASRNETFNETSIGQNKAAFIKYMNSFEEGRKAVVIKTRQKEQENRAKEQLKSSKMETSEEASQSSTQKPTAASSLAFGLASGHVTTQKFVSQFSKSATKFKPTIPPQTKFRKSVAKPSATSTSTVTSTESDGTETTETTDDAEVLAIVEQMEEELEPPVCTPPQPKQPQPEVEVPATTTPAEVEPVTYPTVPQAMLSVPTVSMATTVSNIDPEHPPLPEGWRRTLPKADHLWVSQALFTTNKKGKAKLDWDRVDKLWWYPPQASLTTPHPPRLDRYFAQPLLLWMPRKLWKLILYCPHSGCNQQKLTSAGIYNTVRQVVDIDSNYNLAAEYLECSNCKRKVISWSPGIVKQLDMGHQLQFPVLLTYQNACDIRVIRLLRQRGLGNSSTQLQKKLTEEHSEKHLQRTIQYLTDCQHFVRSSRSGLIDAVHFQEPPQFVPVPKYRWLLTVYGQDIITRIDYIKSSITSIFGRILKMDSTKKIVRKLAGSSAGTAAWATNVGNERGQVLMSVLTVNEGAGLENMANGLMRRYAMAGVPPPEILYVDRDCCSGTTVKTKELFSLWENLVIRLDIWHFMRRIAAGCNTESHPLYSVFLSRLSQCIFQWSKEDLDLLKSAKKSELQKQGIVDPSEEVVIAKIKKRELALHCRRKTRGVVQTATMIYDLLMTFTGPQGCDSTGVPLLNNERMWQIWDSQQRHIECIQDAEGVQLYTQTGVVTKGDIQLPTYRCARGSTSLESFHLHINRFVPGTSASAMHFQAYLLDGLMRWNADRAINAVSTVTKGPETYSGALCQAVNELSKDVLGKEFKADVQNVGIYTGELIGVEYLYSQTGEVLKEDTLVDEDVRQPGAEPLSDVDPDQVDEGFDENEDETVATAEQVFTMPSGSQTESDDNTSDEDSAEDGSNELSREAEDSVGPDHIEGYGEVQALAAYLVSLRNENMSLSNTQASEIIRLWNNLHEYDRQPTTFNPRHRTQLVKGKFKAPKRRTTSVVPGLDSTKRCFLGSNSGPAQWPDCNRYVEAVISRLCELYPGPERSRGSTKARWTLVCKTYREIRERIVSNGKVMSGTAIQMPEVNQATVGQWFIQREKKREQEVLKQGLRPPPQASVSNQPLPAAIPLPPVLPQVNFPLPFNFIFPENTTGKATLRAPPRLIQPKPVKGGPIQIQPRPVQRVSCTATQSTPTRTSVAIQPKPVPPRGPVLVQPKPANQISTKTVSVAVPAQLSRKRTKKQQEESSSHKKSFYEKTCSHCGKPRDHTTHKLYYGSWYCKNVMTEDFETWKSNKNSKKKKTE